MQLEFLGDEVNDVNIAEEITHMFSLISENKMQLFIRGTETHVVQVTGTETVEDVKVSNELWPL